MPGGYKVTEDGRYLLVKWLGDLYGNQSLFDFVALKLNDARMKHGVTEVIDIRSAIVTLDAAGRRAHADDVERMVTTYITHPNISKIAKILLIVPEQESFETASEFRLLMAKHGIDVIPFSSTYSISYFLPFSADELEEMLTNIEIEETEDVKITAASK